MHKRIVVSGWGQVTQGKEIIETIQDPLGMMAQAAGKAQERRTLEVLSGDLFTVQER